MYNKLLVIALLATFVSTIVCSSFCQTNCDDKNACTVDACSGSQCTHTPANCDDKNYCTADYCDTSRGCFHKNITCNDNNPCTIDSCNPSSGCSYNRIICDDKNLCTADTCVTGPTGGPQCKFTPYTCSNNDPCYPQTCNSTTGRCIATPIVCDDKNACTRDTCVNVSGVAQCKYTPMICANNDRCNIATCDPKFGFCVSAPVSCDDNNACTVDTCSPTMGCRFFNKTCDDNNNCTRDACDPNTGCSNTNICNYYSTCASQPFPAIDITDVNVVGQSSGGLVFTVKSYAYTTIPTDALFSVVINGAPSTTINSGEKYCQQASCPQDNYVDTVGVNGAYKTAVQYTGTLTVASSTANYACVDFSFSL